MYSLLACGRETSTEISQAFLLEIKISLNKDIRLERIADEHMTNLDDLIKIEKEYTGLDFKRIQYNKDKHEDLIKDIMSMANADIEVDRYIIIGVIHKNSNDRELIGINKDEFIDSAAYQQLIRDNIEPQIIFDYFKHEIDDKCFGIFKITQCNDQPYMMKKDYGGKLKKGECWIRKGDSQFRLIRADFDRIMDKIISSKRFNGKVKIYFSGYSQDQEIALPVALDIELPSKRAANRLKKLIGEERDKQSLIKSQKSDKSIYGEGVYNSFLASEGERRIASLERELENVKETYREDDYYELFELQSHKLNIIIVNEGDEYIKDASLQIDIDKIDGLIIPEKIYEKPDHSKDKFYTPAALDFRYPEIEDKGTYIRIHNSSRLMQTWNIKHQIPEEAFWDPVRFLFLKDLAGNAVQLNCKLFGENLKEPIETVLKIKVIPNDSSIKE